jgi:hypothetical protein
MSAIDTQAACRFPFPASRFPRPASRFPLSAFGCLIGRNVRPGRTGR